MISEPEVLIIGGGPAGLAAAREAVKAGCGVVLLDDALELGGQLVKQTHKFFGSEMEYAGVRGIGIPEILLKDILDDPNFQYHTRTTVSGFYEDGVVTAIRDEKEMVKFRPKKLIVATGALEKTIPFPNNDLPGVYGAGAVQTLMNVYGVAPGKRCLMVGAGNIGLIVSYQLMQAGMEVAAVVEGMDKVGGYWVHASKIARLGIPILTRYTILEAKGQDIVTGAVIAPIDENWQPLPGEETEIECDFICLAVGLSPLSDIFKLAECRMVYVSQLSGEVPYRDSDMQTTTDGIYVAGDASGVEEASSAMIEGAIAGFAAAKALGKTIPDYESRKSILQNELERLRSGPVGEHIRGGLCQCILESRTEIE